MILFFPLGQPPNPPCLSDRYLPTEPSITPQNPPPVSASILLEILGQPLSDVFDKCDGQHLDAVVYLLTELSNVLNGLSDIYCNKQSIYNLQVNISLLIDGLLHKNTEPILNLVYGFINAISQLSIELQNDGLLLSSLEKNLGIFIEWAKYLPGYDSVQNWSYQGVKIVLYNIIPYLYSIFFSNIPYHFVQKKMEVCCLFWRKRFWRLSQMSKMPILILMKELHQLQIRYR